MGRPDKRRGGAGGAARADQTLALTVNADGDVNYDAIVRRGENKDKWIATGHKALVPKLDRLNSAMPKPDEEEEAATAASTAAALAKRLEAKQASVNPTAVAGVPGAAQYIKYTPAGASAAHASGASTRVIKMQDMPVDPLEPPKFRHTKVPRGPGSPPVPVMHSPPRPLTVTDQQQWKIPPCISNWKNAKGYTIPLDKRLAADGRGLQEVSINDQFAKFTEALYIAEHKARSAVEARSKMQRELLAREKEHKEVELRELAMRARMDRMGGGPGGGGGGMPGGMPDAGDAARVPAAARGEGRVPAQAAAPREVASDDERELPAGHRTFEERRGGGGEASDGEAPAGETKEEREERQRRDEIRRERQRERERERRLEAKDAHGFKRSKVTRDRDRDISEKIALGMAKVTGGEAMYDQRLFNQDTGTGAGLATDDAYNLYDKPLFADRSEIFKATGRGGGEGGGGGGEAGADVDTARFKPDKGFSGADYSRASKEAAAAAGGGGAPQFEKDPEEADPFGLDAFLSDVRAGKRKGPLDGIGKGGGMAAAGGGAGKMEDYAGAGSGRRMDFTAGKQ
jgi:SNW domain-containing protein 1